MIKENDLLSHIMNTNVLCANTNSRRLWIKDKLLLAVLMIELVLMIVEKSDAPFSLESYVFRLTFVMSLAVIAVTKYNKKEWIIIIAVLAGAFLCYRHTGNNDLLRYAAFTIACKEIDLKKALKFTFWVTFTGYLIIVILAVTGIYGNFVLIEDFGRESGVETRYVIGFGHPNTLQGAWYGLLLVLLYAYYRELKLWHMGILGLMFAGLFIITDSKTATLLTLVTIMAVVVTKIIDDKLLFVNDYSEKEVIIKNYSIFVGIVGMILYIFAIGFSIWAAIASYYTKFHGFIKDLDNALTNRIFYLYYNSSLHKGAVQSWTLFGERGNDEYYFDMGWVRLIYWDGIIPGALIIILLGYVLYLYIKRRDNIAIIVLVSLTVYTIVEATFVSAYIGRAFYILLLSVLFEGKRISVELEDEK